MQRFTRDIKGDDTGGGGHHVAASGPVETGGFEFFSDVTLLVSHAVGPLAYSSHAPFAGGEGLPRGGTGGGHGRDSVW